MILLTVAVLMCHLASSMQCTRSSGSLDCVRYSVSIIVDTTEIMRMILLQQPNWECQIKIIIFYVE